MSLDDELLQDAADDARCIAFIRQELPQELKETFTDDDLYYFLDLIIEYYTDSDVLDSEPDAEGYVEIDVEEVAKYLASKARKEKYGDFKAEDLIFVVQAQLDFEDQEAEA